MNFIDLNGNWTLINEKKDINCPATVPGCVHTDLIANKIIDDPFYRDNEVTQMWVCYEDWTYERTFTVSEDFLKNEKLFLECDGLDTLATIYVNGKEIAKTKNMHRRYGFDIKSILKAGENSIKIFFASAPRYAEPIANTGSGFGPGPMSIYGSERVRKAMYTWGWDWGPKIPSAGIWRNIRIKAYNALKIEDFHIRYTWDQKAKKVDFTFKVLSENYTDNPDYVIEVKDPKGNVIAILDKNTKEWTLDNPEIWFPVGYGNQPLYSFTIKTADEEIEKKIGIRKIEWIENKDQWGRTFFVQVNNIPIFSKGADYIPMEQFPSAETYENWNKLLDIVLDTNMNCIRIWGGGIYEDDRFYDLCDEKGILVWQDFMYACAHYPMDDPQLCEEYYVEAVDNIRRLRHHASLSIWSGNNELEQFYDSGFPYGWIDNTPWKEEFRELFEVRIRKIVEEEDPDTFYVRSSSHSEEIFVDPNGHNSGDTHYWDVWHGRAPFTDYRKYYTRYLSEFGFQALPNMETIKDFALPEESFLYSNVMLLRQKCPAGNQLIWYYLTSNYKIPSNFRNMIYISQILQADAIRYGVEHFRRNRNDYRCMGTVYWQLNDCWPSISWASVDYKFRWKALNFMAREFFKPVDLTIEETETDVKLHIVNDNLEDFAGTVRYQLCKTDGTVIFEDTMKGECKALSANMIKHIDLKEYIDKFGKENLFFSCGLDDMAEKHVFFVPAKDANLVKPNYNISACGDKLKVVADAPSFYTQIDVPDTEVRLERNFILLLPGKEYLIDIAENDGLSAEEIAKKATALTIASTY